MSEIARTTTTANEPLIQETEDWFDERLDIGALYRKYGRKVFPVHSTFFFGEMALFAFVILVVTGGYLAFMYIPSNVDVTAGGQTVPEAYASARLIESTPVANLVRNVHHWAAHVMIASIILHMLRIFLSGTYRKPRELNWIIGLVLLILTLGAAFYGYGLPYDAFAVTATGIGYEIARSIPWVGNIVSEIAFGGTFPTLGSLSRMFALHVFVIPLLIMGVLGAHLLIIVKQKHSQPGYARRLAEPGKVLGVPFWPYQALMGVQLLLVMFGVLCLLAAFAPPHPLTAFGPPVPQTPEVKPDWYLIWVYGMLRIIPARVSFSVLGTTIEQTFIGGLVFPAIFFGLLFLVPFLDRTNRHVRGTYQYLQPLRQSATRIAVAVAALVFLATLCLAAYYDKFDLSLMEIWAIVVLAPIVCGAIAYAIVRRLAPAREFDPRSPDIPSLKSRLAAALAGSSSPAYEAARVQSWNASRIFAPDTDIAEQGDYALDNVVMSLHQLGGLAPIVRQTDDPEQLIEVLEQLERVRIGLGDWNQSLIDSIQAEEASERAMAPPEPLDT